MEKSVSLLSSSIVGIRGSAISPGVIDTVKVDCYGQKMSLGQMAQTGRIDINAIAIDPYDPTLVGPITTALKANGFSAYQFSKTRVMVSTPPVSGEEREKVKKHLRKLGEDTKIAIRNIRKNYRKQNKDCDKEVQRITDRFIDEVDRVIADKILRL